MKKMLSCAFNVDTACVEIAFADGTNIHIYTPGVDAELDITRSQQADLDWLIYNKPWEYANLVLSGDLMDYLSGKAEHGLED